MASKWGTAYIDIDIRDKGAVARLKNLQAQANDLLKDIEKSKSLSKFRDDLDDAGDSSKDLSGRMRDLGKAAGNTTAKLDKTRNSARKSSVSMKDLGSRIERAVATMGGRELPDFHDRLQEVTKRSRIFNSVIDESRGRTLAWKQTVDKASDSMWNDYVVRKAVNGLIRRQSAEMFQAHVATQRWTKSTGDAIDRAKGFEGELNTLSKTISRTGPIERMTRSFRALGDRSEQINRRLSRVDGTVDRLRGRFGGLGKSILNNLNFFDKLNEKLRISWRRMDSTVRLVLGLIAVAGGPLTTALSGASATLTALGSSLAFAALGASSLAGVLPGMAYGIGLAASGLKRIEELAPEASSSLNDLKGAFSDVDVPAFMREWETSLSEFFTALSDSLRGDELAASLGQTFSKITDAFTSVINGDLWDPFIEAAEGPLGDALGNLFSAVEPLLNTLLGFMTAAAPFAVQLSEMFGTWASSLQAAFEASSGSEEFTEKMQRGVDSLSSILDFLGSVKDFLGTVFTAGAESGNQFLDILTGVFDKWTTFLETTAGQNSLEEWFSNGLEIIKSLAPLLSGLAEAFDNMVTPLTIAMLANLFDILGTLLPILGEMIEVVSAMGVLNLIADLFREIGQAIQPILPTLKTLANTVFGALGKVISSLAPILEVVAALIGELAIALGPVIQEAASAFASILTQLAPVFQRVFEAIQPLLPVISDLLIQAIQTLLPIVVELATIFGDVLAQALTAFLPVIEALIPIIVALLPAVVQLIVALNPIINIFVNLLPVLMPVIDGLAALLTWVLELITPLIEFIAPIIEWIVQFLAVSKAIDDLGAVFARVWASVFAWLQKAGTTISTFVQSVIGFFTNLGTKVGSTVSSLVTRVINFFKNLWNGVTSWVNQLVQGVISYVVNMASRMSSAVSNVVTKVINFFSNLRTRTLDTVNALIRGVVNFFTGLPNKIYTAIQGLADKILDFFDVSDGVRDIVDNILNFFKQLPSKIGRALAGMGGVITDAIGNVAAKLNPLNWFASGGIVTGPTAAMVGEAGPEAIVPLNRPLHMVDPSVRDLSAALQGQPNQMAFRNGGVAGAAGITIAEGAIQVIAPESDPGLVAESVLDRLVAYAR